MDICVVNLLVKEIEEVLKGHEVEFVEWTGGESPREELRKFFSHDRDVKICALPRNRRLALVKDHLHPRDLPICFINSKGENEPTITAELNAVYKRIVNSQSSESGVTAVA